MALMPHTVLSLQILRPILTIREERFRYALQPAMNTVFLRHWRPAEYFAWIPRVVRELPHARLLALARRKHHCGYKENAPSHRGVFCLAVIQWQNVSVECLCIFVRVGGWEFFERGDL